MAPSSDAPGVRQYLLELDVDFETLQFSGTVGIELAEPRQRLAVNSVGLEIEGFDPGGRITPHPGSEELGFETDHPTDRFSIRFRGRASEKGLLGLYRSRYGSSYILTTQCQAVSARKLFPCLDRPDRKATLALTLTIDSGLEAIFNTPVRSRRERNGRVTLEFEPTPPMSTYLTYLGIGKFDWFRGTGGRTRIACAAPPGRAASGRFAVESSAEILPAFERYFGLDFPLPKLDLIAVPEFAYGAMENWGAISFRDMALLVDRETSGLQKRSTLATIAHEIAHQWFGNLVTMRWWTDMWLNESFATLMEEKVLELLHPESRPLDDLLIEWTGPAMTGDSLPSTHPVSVPVERPEEIGQIFDEIGYGKGSAVLRMLEGYVGEAAFRAGVTAYLKRHEFGNAASEDLWRALEESAGRPLRPILEAWITRPGFPVLRASASGGKLSLTQARFVLGEPPRSETWPIPIGIPTADGGPATLLEGPGPLVIDDPGGAPRLNDGARGFYRVAYEPALLARVLDGFAEWPSVERWGLLKDLLAFLISGDIAPGQYYGFLDATRKESDPLVVHELATQLTATSPGRSLLVLGALLGDRPGYRRHAAPWLAAQVERLGLSGRPNENEFEPVVRGVLAGAAVAFDPTVAAELAERFDAYSTLAPDLRWPVLYAYAGRGTESEFDALVKRIPEAGSEGEANRLERALTRLPHPHLVERGLELATTPLVNRAHLASVVREAALNPAGRTATWAWMQKVLPTLEDRYRGTNVVSRILEQSLPFAALGRSAEAAAFLTEHPFAEGERAAKKGLALLGLYERLLRSVD